MEIIDTLSVILFLSNAHSYLQVPQVNGPIFGAGQKSFVLVKAQRMHGPHIRSTDIENGVGREHGHGLASNLQTS